MEVVHEPAHGEGQPVPWPDPQHLGENAKVVLEVAFLALLLVQLRDRLQSSGDLRLLPGPFKLCVLEGEGEGRQRGRISDRYNRVWRLDE